MADIELVIKIPEKKYNKIGFIVEIGLGTAIDKIIANGTPLPEGHGDLIDANELLKRKVRFEDFDGDTFNIIHEETVINAQPIIKADKGK